MEVSKTRSAARIAKKCPKRQPAYTWPARKPHVPVHKLFPGIFPGFYEAVDMYGTEKVYETFTKAYQEAEAVIPTFFRTYKANLCIFHPGLLFCFSYNI